MKEAEFERLHSFFVKNKLLSGEKDQREYFARALMASGMTSYPARKPRIPLPPDDALDLDGVGVEEEIGRKIRARQIAEYVSTSSTHISRFRNMLKGVDLKNGDIVHHTDLPGLTAISSKAKAILSKTDELFDEARSLGDIDDAEHERLAEKHLGTVIASIKSQEKKNKEQLRRTGVKLRRRLPRLP